MRDYDGNLQLRDVRMCDRSGLIANGAICIHQTGSLSESGRDEYNRFVLQGEGEC